MENTFKDFENFFSKNPVPPVKFLVTEADLVFDNIIKMHSEYTHSYISMNSFFFEHIEQLKKTVSIQHQVITEIIKYKSLYEDQLEEIKQLKAQK